MRRPSPLTVILFAATPFAAGIIGCGSDFTPPPAETAPDDAIQTFLTEGGLPAVAVGVIKDGATVYSKVAGLRKRGDPTPVTDDDAFHIGSNTKAMTALILATLVDAGVLSWDTTVNDVLAGTVDSGAYGAVTLTQLLSHESGMPELDPSVELGFDQAAASTPIATQRRQIVTLALAEPPLSQPGTAYFYSSLNYVVAGAIAEIASGQTWETLMQDRIFTPLGMTHAGFGLPATPGTIDAPWGHDPAPIPPSTPDIAPGFGPAGTVHASLADILSYVQVYLNAGLGPNGRIISEAALAEIRTPRLEHYGFGWIVGTLQTGESVMVHVGSNGNFYAVFGLFPELHDAVIVMTNVGDLPSWDRAGQLRAYLSAHFGLPQKSDFVD